MRLKDCHHTCPTPCAGGRNRRLHLSRVMRIVIHHLQARPTSKNFKSSVRPTKRFQALTDLLNLHSQLRSQGQSSQSVSSIMPSCSRHRKTSQIFSTFLYSKLNPVCTFPLPPTHIISLTLLPPESDLGFHPHRCLHGRFLLLGHHHNRAFDLTQNLTISRHYRFLIRIAIHMLVIRI